jgi:CheY-like chemotaxis protein
MDTENDDVVAPPMTTLAGPQLVRRQVAIDELLAQAVNEMTTRDRDRITLRIAAAGITVAGDRVRLRGALGVLLRLALESVPRDSNVTVTLSRHVTRVVMSLQGRRRTDRGTPPGIDVVMNVVQLHGGRIYSETGSGSLRFLVELPVLERRRIRASALLVEEDLDHIAALTEILHQHGVLTDFATTGAEALQRLGKRSADILIVDEDLGDMTADAFVDAARTAVPALPAIIVGSRRVTNDVAPSLANGAMAFLRKPLDVSDLLHLIDHVR